MIKRQTYGFAFKLIILFVSAIVFAYSENAYKFVEMLAKINQ